MPAIQQLWVAAALACAQDEWTRPRQPGACRRKLAALDRVEDLALLLVAPFALQRLRPDLLSAGGEVGRARAVVLGAEQVRHLPRGTVLAAHFRAGIEPEPARALGLVEALRAGRRRRHLRRDAARHLRRALL